MADQPQPSTIDDLLNADTLDKLQRYVEITGKERGFSDETVQDSFMLLIEEMGEVAKAMRPLHGVKTANDSARLELKHELADVQLLLMSLANKLDVQLHQAIIEKEKLDRQRSWLA